MVYGEQINIVQVQASVQCHWYKISYQSGRNNLNWFWNTCQTGAVSDIHSVRASLCIYVSIVGKINMNVLSNFETVNEEICKMANMTHVNIIMLTSCALNWLSTNWYQTGRTVSSGCQTRAFGYMYLHVLVRLLQCQRRHCTSITWTVDFRKLVWEVRVRVKHLVHSGPQHHQAHNI